MQTSLFVGNFYGSYGYVDRFDFTVPAAPGQRPAETFGKPLWVSSQFRTGPGKGVCEDFWYAAPGGLAFERESGSMYISTGGDTSSSPLRELPGTSPKTFQ